MSKIKKRGEVMDAEDLMAFFGPPPPPDNEFDLSAEVVLNELTDDELLFRESIIKSFFEKATRSGHPIYGFTLETLEKMHAEVVVEFKSRGRDYMPKLDRHMKTDEEGDKKSLVREIKDVVKSEEFKELVEKKVKEEVDKDNRNKFMPFQPDGNQPYTITYGVTKGNMTGGEVHDKKDK